MSPRKQGRRAVANDWRTDAQRAEDARLRGGWWRCSAHGLTTDPLLLGEFAYCGDVDCTNDKPLLLVHSVMDDAPAHEWNEMAPAARRAVRPAEARAAEPEPTETTMTAEPTTDDPRTSRELLLEMLRATDGVAVPLAELRSMLRRAKPSSSASLADVTLKAMARAGLVVRSPAGFVLTDQGRGVALCMGVLDSQTPPPRARHARSAPAESPQESAPKPAPAAPAIADAAASNEATKGDTPDQGPARPTGRRADALTLRVTAQMRARLEEILADGFHGDSVEEVAERYLARALRAFNNAN